MDALQCDGDKNPSDETCDVTYDGCGSQMLCFGNSMVGARTLVVEFRLQHPHPGRKALVAKDAETGTDSEIGT